MVVDLQLKSESFSRDLAKVKGQVARSKKSFDDFGSSVVRAMGGFITVAAATQAVRYLGKEILEAEQSSAKLEAVLRATGNAAGLTAGQIDAMSKALQRSTGVDDDAIKDASAVLATFRSVSGDTFRETIGLALDMSAVFKQDLQSSVVQLGKALEDPITGLTSLRRIGVTFSGAQRQIIEDLVKENKLFEAQQKILEGVAIQVKGTAEEMGSKGLAGNLKTVRVAWDAMFDSVKASDKGFGNATWLARQLGDALAYIRKQTILANAPDSLEGLRFQIEELDAKLAGTATKKGGIPDDAYTRRLRQLKTDKEAQIAGINMMAFGQEQIVKGQARIAAADMEAERTRDAAREKWEKGAADRKRAEKDLLDSQMAGLKALAEETTRITENQWDQFIAGLKTVEEAEEDFIEFLRKDMEAFDKAQEQFAKDEAAREWAAGWGHAMEEVQDKIAKGFEALFLGQITSFRDFASMILTIWAQTMAQMAAADITGGLFKFAKGALGGLGGGIGNYGPGFGAPPAPDLAMAGGGHSGMAPVTINFNVSAIDARGVAQVLAENAPTILGVVARGAQTNTPFRNALAGAG